MGYGSNQGTSNEQSGPDISKILFKFNYSEGTTHAEKISRTNMSLQSKDKFERSLAAMPSGNFTDMAGCDLSAIFFPYRIASGTVDSMPTVAIKQYNQSLYPYHVDFNQTDKVFNRLIGPSGDMMGSAISSDYFMGDTEYLRDADDVRSVGLRLPMMGIGWGKTTGGAPAPSGNDSSLYKGEHASGVNVDPKDYIAAPIDFRYDEAKGVWTMGDESYFARITKCVAGSGYYHAEQVVFYPEIQQWQSAAGTQALFPSGWTEDPGNPNGVLWEIGKFSARPTGTIVEVQNDASASGTFWWFENDDNEFWAEIIGSWAENSAESSGIITKGTNARDNAWRYVWFPPATLSDRYRDEMFGTYTLRRVESTASGVYSVPDPEPASGCSQYLEFQAQNLDEIEFPNIWDDSNPGVQADSSDFRLSYWVPSSGQYVRVKRIKRSNDPFENRDYDYVFKYPIRMNQSLQTDGFIGEFTQMYQPFTGLGDPTANSYYDIFNTLGGSEYPVRSIFHRKKDYLHPGDDKDFWQASDDPDPSIGVGWIDTSGSLGSLNQPSGNVEYGRVILRAVLADANTSGLQAMRLTFDTRGHLDAIQEDSTAVSGFFVDQKVAVQAGDTPGFLDQVLDTPGDWLDKTRNDAAPPEVLEIRHQDPQDKDANRDMDFDVAEAGGTITWTYYTDIEFDSKGHHRDQEVQETFTLDVLPASDPWLEIAAAAGGATIAHIGPDVEDHTNDPLDNITSNDGSIIWTYNVFSFDAKGHHRNAGAATQTGQLNFGSSDNSVFIGLTDEGGDEISLDFTVDPSGITGTTTLSVVTDIQVDTSSFKLQKKTRNITVIGAGAESPWTDVHTGEECS